MRFLLVILVSTFLFNCASPGSMDYLIFYQLPALIISPWVQSNPIINPTIECSGFHAGRKNFTELEWSKQSEQNKNYYICYSDIYINGELFSKSNLPKKQTMEDPLEKIAIQYQESVEKSKYVCKSQLECSKAFSLTQIYITKNSDMKIQVSTDTIIETYNPTDFGKMGFQALKIPGEGHSATIKLKAYCKMTEACLIKATKIMNNYTEYISSHLN